jgi:hypothetical protein
MEGIWSRKTLAAALGVLACAGTPALADPPANPTEAAQQIAAAYWGTNPCGGAIQIAWQGLEGDVNARSDWENPASAYDDPSQNTNCVITVNTDQHWTWPMFCTVIVHEYGHLTGHPHSSDPHDVMYPFFVQPVPQCEPAQAPSDAATPAVAPAPPVARAAHKRLRRAHRRHARLASRS